MSKQRKAPAPLTYDDAKHPPYYGPDYWLNSPFSIARFYGACTINQVYYLVDELSEDLCREDVHRQRLAAYTDADKAIIKAKYLQDDEASTPQAG